MRAPPPTPSPTFRATPAPPKKSAPLATKVEVNPEYEGFENHYRKFIQKGKSVPYSGQSR
jgi:hypothetical protein